MLPIHITVCQSSQRRRPAQSERCNAWSTMTCWVCPATPPRRRSRRPTTSKPSKAIRTNIPETPKHMRDSRSLIRFYFSMLVCMFLCIYVCICMYVYMNRQRFRTRLYICMYACMYLYLYMICTLCKTESWASVPDSLRRQPPVQL